MSNNYHKRFTIKDLRELRKRYGVTYQDLALSMDTYINRLMAIEKGDLEISNMELLNLCLAVIEIASATYYRNKEKETAGKGTRP